MKSSILRAIVPTLTAALLAGSFGFQALAESDRFSHRSTPAETADAKAINKKFLSSPQYKKYAATPVTWQPVVDTADFGYVLMNAEENYSDEVAALRQSIAQNLPTTAKLVILADASDAESVRTKYLQWISADRLIVAADAKNSTSGGFWARDSFPVPVVDSLTKKAHLVSARYFRYFNSADTIAQNVNGTVKKIQAVFVGGNLLADEDGQCFTVDSDRLYDMDAETLKNIYGCKDVKMMPYVSGIGDVDEVIKPLPGKRMLTNTPSYKADLEAMGYTVIMLPEIKNSYRTYANSLVVGKKVFMPSFGVSTDTEAAAVYTSLGFEVVQIRSNYLSDRLLGSIHCQTMAYPKMDQAALFKALGIKRVL